MKYKYPELVQNVTNQEILNAQYNTLIPALGMVLLGHALNYLYGDGTKANRTIAELQDTTAILSDKYLLCSYDYQVAMKEYSEV